MIVTGYGGQLEYLHKESAYLVDYEMISVAVAMGRRSYSPDQRWAGPDIDHAAKLMRQVFENHDEAKRRGDALRAFVSLRFHGEAVARRFATVFTDGSPLSCGIPLSSVRKTYKPVLTSRCLRGCRAGGAHSNWRGSSGPSADEHNQLRSRTGEQVKHR